MRRPFIRLVVVGLLAFSALPAAQAAAGLDLPLLTPKPQPPAVAPIADPIRADPAAGVVRAMTNLKRDGLVENPSRSLWRLAGQRSRRRSRPSMSPSSPTGRRNCSGCPTASISGRRSGE